MVFWENDIIVVFKNYANQIGLLRFTKEFEIVWQRSISNTAEQKFSFKDIAISNHSIVIVGRTVVDDRDLKEQAFYDAVFISVDPKNGKSNWFKKLGVNSYLFISGVVTIDEDIYVAGMNPSERSPSNLMLFKLNSNGNLEWLKKILLDSNYSQVWDIINYNDVLIIGGSVKRRFSDGAIFKVDKNGILLENKIFNSDTWDSINKLVNINDQEILILSSKKRLSRDFASR